MDAGGRATQEAKAEKRSLYLINEHSSTFSTKYEDKRSFVQCSLLIVHVYLISSYNNYNSYGLTGDALRQYNV